MTYRVYLGEDTPAQALFMKGVLSQGGALDITTHGDGLDLLLSIQENPPDLVVSDIVLPTLDGVALAQILKFHEETRNIPLILVSALGEEYRQNLQELGVDAFIPKPLSVPFLRETVARLLTENDPTLQARS